MNHKVVLISTGGTIASRYDPAQGRVVSSQSGDDLIAMLPGADAVAALREHPLTPYLGRIACPALIVAGGKDAVAGAGGSVLIARAIGEHARLEILQQAGHGVYAQARDEFRPLLLKFLEESGLRST